MENIINLPIEFDGKGEVKGASFKCIRNSGYNYLYQVDFGKKRYYEVFTSKPNPVCIDFKERIYSETDFRVSYPKANSFGLTAWTFVLIDDANVKFEALVSKNNDTINK